MKKVILSFSLLLIGGAMLQAQTEETRSLASFAFIKVGQSIKVTLQKGSANTAIVQVRGVALERVATRVEGSTLRIEMKNGSYFSKEVNVAVTYNGDLRGVRVNSSASISGLDEISGSEFEVSGSSSGHASLVLNVRDLDVKVSSSSTIQLEGKAKRQDINVSSSGKYSAFDLDSEDVDVNVSSSGRVSINVHGNLDARASSSGSVRYRGKPNQVSVATSSSGRIVAD